MSDSIQDKLDLLLLGFFWVFFFFYSQIKLKRYMSSHQGSCCHFQLHTYKQTHVYLFSVMHSDAVFSFKKKAVWALKHVVPSGLNQQCDLHPLFQSWRIIKSPQLLWMKVWSCNSERERAGTEMDSWERCETVFLQQHATFCEETKYNRVFVMSSHVLQSY